MGLFAWLERKLFLGDVIKDYGLLDEKAFALGRLRTSVLLCRRSNVLRLVFRTSGRGPMSASVSYATVDATQEALERLEQVLRDAREEIRMSGRRS